MGLLSTHEEKVWQLFQSGKTTGEIADLADINWLFENNLLKDKDKKNYEDIKLSDKDVERLEWSSAYVSRVLNRARQKIEKQLREHASSHRLDIESIQDYKGLLIGFDYQANAQVYIVFTIKLGPVVWYKHDSYAGKLCDGTPYGNGGRSNGEACPKYDECRETLDTIMEEYSITLRPDEEQLYMTQQSISIFSKLAAKEVPRYKRKED